MSSPSRFFLGLFTLLASLGLQFWLVPFGIRADLAFTALVAFAFLFETWEFVAFILLAVLIINWQPGFSTDIFAFALIPLAVRVIQKLARASAWVGGMVAILASLLILYFIIDPGMIVNSFPAFFLDVIFCLITGQIILWGMEKRS